VGFPGEARRSSASSRVRPRGRIRQPRSVHVFARARLRVRALGDPVAAEKGAAREFLLPPAPDLPPEEPPLRGRTLEAIVEGPEETEHLEPPAFPGPRDRWPPPDQRHRRPRRQPGEIVRVRVSETHDYDLVGGIVS
jgi:hypothetical protein